MPKQLTVNQILGEIGENAVRGRFLTMGFQFDGRSRLEAGIDGIAEVMDKGQPIARMIAVQVKATDSGRYVSETDDGFTYLLRRQDLEYWRGSNLPVIVVFFRRSDNSFYWKEVSRDSDLPERRLQIDKAVDVLDSNSVNRLAALTVSFYREAGGQQLFTSAAQMFDERGRGFVLKGKRAHTESRGRHPYMTRDDAREIIENVLAAYKTHHKTLPARVIVLKTSRFKDEEAEGILDALTAAGTELRDLVWVQESYSVKLLRDGNYPVLRGTFVDLAGNGLLYTNGSMPYYGTYPGLYDPRPLLLCPHESCDSTIAQLAEEVFSLTKINWNSTQMNQRLPISIRAARMVGEVLKYMKEGQVESTDHRKYI